MLSEMVYVVSRYESSIGNTDGDELPSANDSKRVMST